MNHWAASYEKRRRDTERQMDAIAERVAEGWSVAAAGRDIGVGQQRSSQIWKQVREGLGPQAV